MAEQVDGFPGEAATIDSTNRAIQLTVDESVYPVDAVYGAAYIFIDRSYVLIDRPGPTRFRVTLTSKRDDVDAAALRAMVGEFANELLSCAWRYRITKENLANIETMTAQAIAGAMGPPSLDELAAFDFSAQAFEDPLGIATSWEEKYKKEKPAPGKKDGETP
jgi:His-Xaa-Ser system protein HxsD